MLALLEADTEALSEADGETETLILALLEADIDAETEAEIEALGLIDIEGDSERLSLADGD